ncbi:MAG: hypothetical protein KKB37_02255 [Alphaproteobacteria bacterium]|nr:hypothetical protein [Alphaproteobacteria bacterium]
MQSVFYNGAGKAVARLAGRLPLTVLPGEDLTGYRVEYVLTADDVRAEAARRMMMLVGARDERHLEMTIANGNREAIRLLRVGADNWTPEQAARAAQLEQVDVMIEAIRAASNVLEPVPPADYADDRYWPAF